MALNYRLSIAEIYNSLFVRLLHCNSNGTQITNIESMSDSLSWLQAR